MVGSLARRFWFLLLLLVEGGKYDVFGVFFETKRLVV